MLLLLMMTMVMVFQSLHFAAVHVYDVFLFSLSFFLIETNLSSETSWKTSTTKETFRTHYYEPINSKHQQCFLMTSESYIEQSVRTIGSKD